MANQSTLEPDPTASCACYFCRTPFPEEGSTLIRDFEDNIGISTFYGQLYMYFEQLWQQAQAKKEQQPHVVNRSCGDMLVAFIGPDEEVKQVEWFVKEFEDAFKLQESLGGRVPYLDWFYPVMQWKLNAQGRYIREQRQFLRNHQESLKSKSAGLSEQLRADPHAAEPLERLGKAMEEARRYKAKERELEEWEKHHLEEVAIFDHQKVISHAETSQQAIENMKGMVAQQALHWAMDRAFEEESEEESEEENEEESEEENEEESETES